MNTLDKKNIIVGITGGIAAYKSADLVRRLREAGAEVRVVMTRAAKEFITPLTLQAVSGHAVHTDLLDPNAEAAMGHIELARWADLIVIAPASADFLAKFTHGLANDLLSTLCLATAAPIVLVPAMNQQMWLNAATQDNIQVLQKRGVHLFGPAEGSQACGEFGPGRMPEPKDILNYIAHFLFPKFLKNKKIIITAGATRENIDPVRYISNRSSGKMGFSLAEAAAIAGAQVTLIAGPTHLNTPHQVKFISVETAEEMYEAVQNHIKNCDLFIGAAAVTDYRVKNSAAKKIKKTKADLKLDLIENPDIIAAVSKFAKKLFLVGFAAETDHLIENAKKKLQDKKLDLVIANQVGDKEQGFESDYNQVVALWKNGQREFPLQTKKQLAFQLIQFIAEQYHAKNST